MSHKMYKREVSYLITLTNALPNKLNGSNPILGEKSNAKVAEAKMHLGKAVALLREIE